MMLHLLPRRADFWDGRMEAACSSKNATRSKGHRYERSDRTLLGASGLTSNKKLLGAPGIATRSKDATSGSWLYY